MNEWHSEDLLDSLVDRRAADVTDPRVPQPGAFLRLETEDG